MERMVCPGCRHSPHGVITPACPVCEGTGTVALGPAALTIHEPAAVAAAIAYAVEAAARVIDDGTTLSDDRAGLLREQVALLREAGIIGHHAPAVPSRPDNVRRIRRDIPGQQTLAQTPALTIAKAYQPDTTELDAVLFDATPYQYTEGDRPLARGLPVLSATGHPSSTARITHPADTYTDMTTQLRDTRAVLRDGRVLAECAPEAVRLKRRRRKRAAA